MTTPAASPSVETGARRVALPVAAALAVAAGALGGGAATWWGERRLAEALVMRPPVVVVDYGPIREAFGRGADPGALQEAFSTVKENVARFERAGYLVVNRIALETFPGSLAIPVPAVVTASVGAPVGGPPGGSSGPAGDLPATPRIAPAGATATMSPEEAAALMRALLGGAGQGGSR